MSNVVWIKQRQLIAIHPFSSCASVEVKRINVTGQWDATACDWSHRVLLVSVQSGIVFAKECVDCKRIYLQSRSTVGIILDEYKPVWGWFQILIKVIAKLFFKVFVLMISFICTKICTMQGKEIIIVIITVIPILTPSYNVYWLHVCDFMLLVSHLFRFSV